MSFLQSIGIPKAVTFLLAWFAAASTATAGTILIIDVTNPSRVVFTATNVNAQNDGDESWLSEGISLIGFFRSSLDDGSLRSFDSPSNLKSPGGAFAYSTLTSVNFADRFSSTYLDLSIFGSGFSEQAFSSSSPALSGESTANLSAWTALLPVSGTTGNIYSSDGISYRGPLIGQFSVISTSAVVPEPAAATLFGGLAVLCIVALRRRR